MSFKVVIYRDANYSGLSQELDEGSYDVSNLTIGNDQLSSLKITNGFKVILYENPGFSGRSKSFTSDTPFVGSDFNDITSSIRVDRLTKKTLNLVSVKCIKPSSGIDDFARGIFGTIGGLAGGAAAVAGATVTGGLLIAATGVAAVGGAGAGVQVIEGLDHFFAGADDLYIKVDSKKIWPNSGKYKEINSQQTKETGYSYQIPENGTTIELWDYDSISSDDKLGYLTIPESHNAGYFTYLVSNNDEGSVYEINIQIVS
ncbi:MULTISPECIES: hypothetical protein [unclassified Tolypothrix]|uniref:hypothetical protein n=1 Tax=unclassified Tolypothrix TaxID=2649714 RepID=UPI0005EAC280|nr:MULTISPECIES: hypothetical protein [unclassified Tolypothrix]BAY90747.1 hypothetical protein NIES3275_27640 [Microchaete diplosiphon NIES-3275]EKF04419.1 hypothetical protein FDUTEX481_02099 [Tolypothrix sp. PCC 7601]MBE9081050.1 hypothetical protein [Tolypothrix sp. LEGE 11397]UYD24885.1 hypothetical protein HGR01_26220 [Tolypothrix sp. PCC 7712]UYD32883.1 hypothetical protein HG267_28415 [Tolypothrix sp. PCC 7601]